jgi:hypothetical protein
LAENRIVMRRAPPLLLTDRIISGPKNPLLDEDELGGDTDYICPECNDIVLANFDSIAVEASGVVVATCAVCGTDGLVTLGPT